MQLLPPSRTSGFSLFELAIVLAIVGLLTGAIIGGKSMIHQSQLQAVVRDFTKYNDAYQKFTIHYGGKPGDLNGLTGSPTSIWGSADPTPVAPNTCFTALGTAGGTATCNGDGNNFIAGPYATGTLTKPEEIFVAIQQLSNAKLIEGKYTGKSNSASSLDAVSGKNVPAGPFENSGYMFITVQPITANNTNDAPNYFYGNYGTVIIFGGADATGLDQLLSPKDASFIDRKMDDGLPAMGSMLTYLKYPHGLPASAATSCVVNGVALPTVADGRAVTYNVSAKGALCNLINIIDVK